MSILTRIKNRIVKPKEERYITIGLERAIEPLYTTKLDERIRTVPPMDKLELLYFVDGITFEIINDYVCSIVGPGYYYETEDAELLDRLNKWSKNIGLKIILEDIVRDIFIYGGSWVEIVPDKNYKTIQELKIINPKTMEFIRDIDGNVKLDEEGKPEGYEQTVFGEVRRWYKDRIEVKDGRVLFQARPNEDLRDRIAYFKLYGLGESYLGMTPLQSIYKLITIRMNLEDTVGESAFRGGGIVAYITGKPSQDVIDNLKKDLKNITSKNIFIMEDKIKLETVPTPEIREKERLIYCLLDEQCMSMGVHASRYFSGIKVYRGEVEKRDINYELKILSLQERLAYQIKKYILSYLLRLWKIDVSIDIKFRQRMPTMKLSRSRMLATLARRNLLQYDPELELRLRQEMDLPYTFVLHTKKEWERLKKTVIPTKEVDIIKE